MEIYFQYNLNKVNKVGSKKTKKNNNMFIKKKKKL